MENVEIRLTELTAGSGDAAPTKLDRVGEPAPSPVTLEPGRKASKNSHLGVVPDGGV
ncbi:MAG: hypothetical protein ABW215_01160 [Kibdelosporangium sp.]